MFGLLFFSFYHGLMVEYKVHLIRVKIKKNELQYCSECTSVVVSEGVASLCIELSRYSEGDLRSSEGGLRKGYILVTHTCTHPRRVLWEGDAKAMHTGCPLHR